MQSNPPASGVGIFETGQTIAARPCEDSAKSDRQFRMFDAESHGLLFQGFCDILMIE